MIKLLLVTALSYILIKLLISNAKKLKLLDIPNERSHHCSIVPRGGGIGFVVAFFLAILTFKFQLFLEYWYVFASIFMVFLVGVADDRYNVSAKLKFIVIFIAVFLLWLYGMSIDSFGVWFGYELSIGWFALPFSMFALAGFTNALNLIDGLDGLAATISMVIIAVFGYIGYINGDDLMYSLSLFSVASLLGFIVLNYNPAKIFMGDSGSLSLGFMISVLAVKSIAYIHPVVVLYMAAVPILDTLVVIIRRIRRGRSPFSPDKTHFHHILVNFIGDKDEEGNTINGVKRTVWFVVLLQVGFCAIGVLLAEYITIHQGIAPLLGLIGFALIFVLVYVVFTSMKKRMMKQE